MMMTIEGMISKSQKSFQTLKERVQQVVTVTSSLQYRQFEVNNSMLSIFMFIYPFIRLFIHFFLPIAGTRTSCPAEDRAGP